MNFLFFLGWVTGKLAFNPFTPKISVQLFSLLSAIQVLWCEFNEFGIGSTNNPLTDDFSLSSSFNGLLLY